MTPAQAGHFLRRPQGAPVLRELCEFMASEPVVVQVEGRIANRDLPRVDGRPPTGGSRRHDLYFVWSLRFPRSGESVHGSDRAGNGGRGNRLFLAGLELVGLSPPRGLMERQKGRPERGRPFFSRVAAYALRCWPSR